MSQREPSVRDIKMSGRALVIGTAATVMDDLREFQTLARCGFDYEIFVVNEAFRFWPQWDHWVSLHPEKMKRWRREADMIGRGHVGSPIHLPDLDLDDWDALCRKGDPVDFPHQRHPWRVEGAAGDEPSGSSGLFAARLALRFGYDKVCLVGVPMTSTPHHERLDPWVDASRFTAAWRAAERELEGRVRSFSGWTRTFLGVPTLQWWSH